jgi:hypothetical protein
MAPRIRVLLCVLAAALIVWSLTNRGEQSISNSSNATAEIKGSKEAVSPEMLEERLANSPVATAAVPSSLHRAVTKEPVARFEEWTTRYLGAGTPEEQQALVQEGVVLAKARRPVFKTMIRENPRLAVESAVPMVVRQELPAEVTVELESRVGGRGALRVYQGVGADNRSPVSTVRVAEFADGKTYDAHVYGRRAESVNWVGNASLHGVALETDFAVDEDPIRVLATGERPDPALPAVTVCPVSGDQSATTGAEVITPETPAVEAFGEIVYLCNGTHTTIYREQLIYAEGSTGGPIGFTGVLPAAPTPSIGNVRVLVIPMTFADQNDIPSSESKLYEVLRDVGDHYAKASYGKLTLLTTVTPPIKLPHSEAWYIQKGFFQWRHNRRPGPRALARPGGGAEAGVRRRGFRLHRGASARRAASGRWLRRRQQCVDLWRWRGRDGARDRSRLRPGACELLGDGGDECDWRGNE